MITVQLRWAMTICLAGSLLAVGTLVGCDDKPNLSTVSQSLVRQRSEKLAGAPKQLASLHHRSNLLLDGGVSAFRAQIALLRGYPIVVNKWASWCEPCRAEFPFFQRAALGSGKRVAFLGVNVADRDRAAGGFLARFPLSYPSYKDHDEAIARFVGVPAALPATIFYDKHGNISFRRQGSYRSAAELTRDIERYAGENGASR